MQLDRFTRLLFVAYCVEAGLLLLALPWTASWERTCLRLPLPGLVQSALLGGWGRGAVSGFGLVHLAWVANDVGDWVGALRRGRGGAPS